MIARALTSKKQCVFASLLPTSNEDDIFWKRPLAGISDAASELEQFQVRVDKFFFEHYNEKDFIKQTEAILRLQPAGVIFSPKFKKESQAFIKKLEKKEIPYIFLESKIDDCNYLAYVGSDGYISGRVAANLIDFGTSIENDILVINLAKDLDNGKNQGMKITLEIPTSDSDLIQQKLDAILSTNKNIKAIFITGSKVHKIAEYLIKKDLKEISLVGYDPIEKNIKYLKHGSINFLIGQHPYQQGFKTVKKLFDHVLLHHKITKDEILPVDILSRENIKLYKV